PRLAVPVALAPLAAVGTPPRSGSHVATTARGALPLQPWSHLTAFAGRAALLDSEEARRRRPQDSRRDSAGAQVRHRAAFQPAPAAWPDQASARRDRVRRRWDRSRAIAR